MDLDTYYDTHPNNPANQDEPVSKITYAVSVDEGEHFFEFDFLEDAEIKFNEVINGDKEFHEIALKKYIDYENGKPIKYTTADACFLQMKQKIHELSSLENSFAWSLLKIKV